VPSDLSTIARLAFADGRVDVAGKPVAKASAVFAVA
jgi:hypothetical protein